GGWGACCGLSVDCILEFGIWTFNSPFGGWGACCGLSINCILYFGIWKLSSPFGGRWAWGVFSSKLPVTNWIFSSLNLLKYSPAIFAVSGQPSMVKSFK